MQLELSTPIQYSEFIEKMFSYFDEDEKELKLEFLFLINNRLRSYLVLKILSIFN
ncbi:hypothetical protein D3C84_1304300 [compost metagenome]